MREASSLVLSARLQAEGAQIRAYDPVAAEEARVLMPGRRLRRVGARGRRGSRRGVLVTEWPEFSELDWSAVAAAMAGKLVVDGRNASTRPPSGRPA